MYIFVQLKIPCGTMLGEATTGDQNFEYEYIEWCRSSSKNYLTRKVET